MTQGLGISATKAVTIQRLADELGIHKSTVSLAFSGKGRVSALTRDRILRAAAEMGFEPDPLAQRLANRANNNLIYLCSGVLDTGRGTEKIGLIQTALAERGLEVPIYTFSKPTGTHQASHASLMKQLCRQRPKAIVCSTHMLGEAVWHELQTYQREGGVLVTYDIPVPLQCDRVIYDRIDNAYQGARYLIEHGHRRIGMAMSRVPEGLRDGVATPQSLRLEGFKKALAEADLPWRDDWFFENTTFEEGGAQLARRFLALQDRPTGLCIVNDYVALAFMVEVMRAGVSVPQDVSIVGHDNQTVASYCPVPLTSVSQPVEQIVAAVVSLLLQRIGGSELAPQTVIVPGQLIERESVVPPNR